MFSLLLLPSFLSLSLSLFIFIFRMQEEIAVSVVAVVSVPRRRVNVTVFSVPRNKRETSAQLFIIMQLSEAHGCGTGG
jgi:hypothetical protein